VSIENPLSPLTIALCNSFMTMSKTYCTYRQQKEEDKRMKKRKEEEEEKSTVRQET